MANTNRGAEHQAAFRLAAAALGLAFMLTSIAYNRTSLAVFVDDALMFPIYFVMIVIMAPFLLISRALPFLPPSFAVALGMLGVFFGIHYLSRHLPIWQYLAKALEIFLEITLSGFLAFCAIFVLFPIAVWAGQDFDMTIMFAGLLFLSSASGIPGRAISFLHSLA
jgi:hypothetical protein